MKNFKAMNSSLEKLSFEELNNCNAGGCNDVILGDYCAVLGICVPFFECIGLVCKPTMIGS